MDHYCRCSVDWGLVGADPSADFNALGARLGILTGYNWRIGSDLLLGLEVDFGAEMQTVLRA